MDHSPTLSLAQILSRLAQSIALQQTGTFLIATTSNSSCRFALQAGQLTHCVHKRDYGERALYSLLQIEAGTCSLSPHSTHFRAEAAVEHQRCVELLQLHPPLLNPPPVSRPHTPPRPLATATTTPTPPPSKAVNNRFYRGGAGLSN